jgi:hypothetical protein
LSKGFPVKLAKIGESLAKILIKELPNSDWEKKEKKIISFES